MKGNFNKGRYNKRAGERISRRRQLLQEEFYEERLKLVAAIKDVTGCPSFKSRNLKIIKGRKIFSNIVLQNRYKITDLRGTTSLTHADLNLPT